MRTDRGPVGKWKKRIGKTEDDNCKKCGVQETGWHLVFECPMNNDAREEKIKGHGRSSDMGGARGQGEDQERRVEGGSLLRKSDLIEGLGIRTGGLSRIYFVFSARVSAGREFGTAIFAFVFMYPEVPLCTLVPRDVQFKKNKNKGRELLRTLMTIVWELKRSPVTLACSSTEQWAGANPISY